jgi:hypothetical protein
VLVAGPTQSGKSLLARRLVADGRNFAVVMGTKPKDATLDAYEKEEGFTRIDHWPPVRSDFKDQEPGQARFILWPKIVTVDDLHKYRTLFAKALRAIYVDGGWTVVIDETLWFSDKAGLDLGRTLGTMAYGSASNALSFLFLMQRPSGVPRILWQSCTNALLFHLGVTNDVREMASLGTEQPRAVVEAVQNLRGHQFLDLPCRGGSSWSVSEVEL